MPATIGGVVWRLDIGDIDDLTDFTTYVSGMQVTQSGAIGRTTTGKATIRLDNSSGVFTPGIGGTYSNVEWFKKFMKITATVGSETASDVFHGVVREFKLVDSGQSSYVDITGICGMSIASRGPQSELDGTNPFASGFGSSTPAAVVEGMMSTDFNGADPGVALPRLGETADAIFDLGEAPTTPTLRSSALPVANARQLIDNHVLPSGPFTLWATDIQHDSGNNRAKYKGCMVGNTLRKTTVDDGAASANGDAGTTGSRYNRRLFEFTDDTTDTSKLYYAAVKFDFTNTELANRCTTTSTYTPASTPKGAQSVSSIENFGVRARNFPQTVNETEATALEVSTFWAIRFSDVEFTIQKLELKNTNHGISAGGTSAQKRYLGDLLDIRSGIWNAADVTVNNLRGQTSTQVRSVAIIGRTIRVTPADFTISLDVRGSSQYGAFILDESRLDQDRIF